MGGELQAICDEAAAGTGLDDFGDDWFLAPLRAWVDDLAQDTLTDRGRRILRGLAVRDVARRLRVLATWCAHPEIAEVPLPSILYVTGLERSGTTLLHNLLALHPDARALLRWELMEPVPPPEAATHATDPRIAEVQASADRQRGTLLEHMHWVDADEPEECVWGYIDSVSMLGQAPTLWMPSWWRVLRESDLTTVFADYRQLVQTLLWKHPAPPGGFLVLKAPQVGNNIATLAAVLPEARFVVTDRDPFRCVTSMAVLGEAIAEPFCTESPMEDDGRGRRFAVSVFSPKLAAIADFTAAAPERAADVPYPQLVERPAATAMSVVAGAGFRDVDLTPAVDAFLERQRAGQRAAPPGELRSMGYTRDDVWADPAIGAYCTRFGIEPEVTRLTGASPPPGAMRARCATLPSWPRPRPGTRARPTATWAIRSGATGPATSSASGVAGPSRRCGTTPGRSPRSSGSGASPAPSGSTSAGRGSAPAATATGSQRGWTGSSTTCRQCWQPRDPSGRR